METTTESEVTAAADGAAALDLLEERVVAIVDQLKEARTARERAEGRLTDLQQKVQELEDEAMTLRKQSAAAERVQQSVKQRVESLLERIEAAE